MTAPIKRARLRPCPPMRCHLFDRGRRLGPRFFAVLRPFVAYIASMELPPKTPEKIALRSIFLRFGSLRSPLTLATPVRVSTASRPHNGGLQEQKGGHHEYRPLEAQNRQAYAAHRNAVLAGPRVRNSALLDRQ